MNVSEIINRIRSTQAENIVDYIKSFARICIWGTGTGADMIAEGLEKIGVDIQFFVDNDPSKWKTLFHEKEVKTINDISNNMLVIIAVSPMYNIHEQLEKNYHKEYLYIDPVFIFYGGLEKNHKENIVDVLSSNSEKINEVVALLEDKESQELYSDLLVHRAVHDINLILKHYQPNQYFGNDLVSFVEGTIVDCGAFQGDTLKRYLSQCGSNTEYSYYAFEADKVNFAILKKFCKKEKLKNVYPFNLAIGEKDGKLLFRSNRGKGMMGGKIVEEILKEENCETVNAITLDSIMHNIHVNFIMADIEGAELMLLDGGRNIIKRDMPMLAISAYHKLEDMWNIPLKIKSINSKYSIYFRHHMVNLSDTICYALK